MDPLKQAPDSYFQRLSIFSSHCSYLIIILFSNYLYRLNRG